MKEIKEEHKEVVKTLLEEASKKEDDPKPNSLNNIDIKKVEKFVKEEIIG